MNIDLAPLWWLFRIFRAQQYGGDETCFHKEHSGIFLRSEKAAPPAQQGHVGHLFIHLQLLSTKDADEPLW